MPLGEQIQHSLLLQGSSVLIAIIAFFIAIIFTFIAYRMTSPPTTRGKRIVLFTLRILAFAMIIFALLEPLWVTKGIKSLEPEVAIILDNSRSIAKSDSAQAIEYFRNGVEVIGEDYKTELYFAGESLKTAVEPNFTEDITALGNSLLNLKTIYNTPDKSGIRPNIGAAFMISDGQNNLGEDPVSVASRMPFPIYVVGVGRETPPKNIAVRRIVANKIGYKDVPTTILAYIEGWGIDEEAEVLFKNGAKILGRKSIKPGQKGEQVEVEFEFTPTELGQNYFRILTPLQENEMIDNDNSRSFSMNVLPSRKKILLAFTSLNWDYTFVKRALEENEHYEIKSADFSGHLRGDFTAPMNDEQLAEYDAIALINFSIGRSTCRYFTNYLNNGGSILYITGPQTRFCEQLIELSPIESLPQVAWTANRFNPVITIEGLSHPVLDLSGNEDDDEIQDLVQDESWPAQLPPLRGFMMLDKPKKQSRILMEHPDLPGIPIISVFEAGTNRQALINGGDFWRWSFTPFGFGGDNRIYKRIIQNTAQWLMVRDERSPFVLSTDNKVYRSGEPVYFNATLRNDAGSPLEGKSIELTIIRTLDDGSVNDTIKAIMEESGGGFYSLRMPSMGEGDFKVRGKVIENEDTPEDEKWTTFRVEEYSTEMADLRKNREMLETIANRSGGKYLEQTEYKEFLANLNLRNKNVTIRDEYTIWEKWWLLIVILSLLALEWFIRKRSNLP